MSAPGDNRFQDFFEDDRYVVLKNLLYNYRLRKQAVESVMRDEAKELVLEVGSGLSPVLTSWDRVVYTDLSFSALKSLRAFNATGHYVVADGMSLPFKASAFSHVISSEVLEHLADDRKALQEIARVMKSGGGVVVTFPHRRAYFAFDDQFVRHQRRYELSEMASMLQEAGLQIAVVRKVLGPLEKITMMIVTGCIAMFQGEKPRDKAGERPAGPAGAVVRLFRWANGIYAVLARIDTWIMPRAWSTVLLIKAVKGDHHP
jgi:SAM-dependent methyltransferase